MTEFVKKVFFSANASVNDDDVQLTQVLENICKSILSVIRFNNSKSFSSDSPKSVL